MKILLKLVFLIVFDYLALNCSTEQGLVEVVNLGDVLGSSRVWNSYGCSQINEDDLLKST